MLPSTEHTHNKFYINGYNTNIGTDFKNWQIFFEPCQNLFPSFFFIKTYYFKTKHCYDTSQNMHTPYSCVSLFSLFLRTKYTACSLLSFHGIIFRPVLCFCITIFQCPYLFELKQNVFQCILNFLLKRILDDAPVLFSWLPDLGKRDEMRGLQ